MSVSGKLETMALSDLIQFIGLGRKTGVLSVSSGLSRKQLVFKDGVAIFCSTNHPKEYLGQHLLARTSLTEADLEEAFREQDETRRPLGEILVKGGKISADGLRTVLRRKVEDSMYELFESTAGAFDFAERDIAEHEVPVRVEVDCRDLVMEGARRADEMAVVRKVIPGPQARFRVHRERFPAGFPQNSGDCKLIELAEQGLNLGSIFPRFHASDFEIQARLAALVRQGCLEVDTAQGDRHLDRDGLLWSAGDLAVQGRFLEALEMLREGARRFFDDARIAEALRSLEDSVRRRASESTGDMTAVPRLAASLERLTSGPLSSKQAFVVSRINGTWSVRSIVQICPFDEVEVLAILDDLCRKGLVEVPVAVSAR